MEVTVADRIIELAKRWQEPERWRSSYEFQRRQNEFVLFLLASDARKRADTHLHVYAGEKHAAAIFHQELGERATAEAREYAEQDKQEREEIDARRAELAELIALLEKHFPGLSDLVPRVDFCERTPPDDRWPTQMAKIASCVAVSKSQPPPAVTRIAAEVGTKPPTPPKTEGAVSQGVFVYKGMRAENIPPAPWRLLEFMEGRIEGDTEEAYQYAINEHDKDSTPGAIKSLLTKANAALEAVTYPKNLSKVRGLEKLIWS